MADDRQLTPQGQERKVQLLEAARPSCSPSGATTRRASSTSSQRGRRGQGPLLLVLREQGSPVPRAGRAATGSACAGPRPPPSTPTPNRCCASARAPRPRSTTWPPTPTSSPSSRSRTSRSSSPTSCARAPRSTPRDVAADRPRGHRRRDRSATRTPSCWPTAWSARWATTATSTAPGACDGRRRPGRLRRPLRRVLAGRRRRDRPPGAGPGHAGLSIGPRLRPVTPARPAPGARPGREGHR